jgi:very-short-patch-repair endonuclease
VELDGWQFHKDRHALENDRERDAENLRHGTATIRMTEPRLTVDPDREARRLQEILDRLAAT